MNKENFAINIIVTSLASKLGTKYDVKKYSNGTLQFPISCGTMRLNIEEDDVTDNYRMYRYFRPAKKRDFIQVGLYSLHYFADDITASDVADSMVGAAETAIKAAEEAMKSTGDLEHQYGGLVLDIINAK